MTEQRPPSLVQLSIVEFRKTTDTRSGLALLVIVAALTALAVGGQVGFGPTDGRTVGSLVVTAMLPVSVLLPVVAVLSVTTEFTRRTALTTFALVPVRGRVVAAKAVAALALAVAATVVGWVLTLVIFALGAAAGRTLGGAGIPASVLAQLGLVNAVTMLCGLAFGLLLRYSAAAIVTYYVVPIGWSAAAQLIPALGSATAWLDIGQSRMPLVEPGVTAREWAMFATSCLLWVALPAAIGLVRVHRADLA
jgi:ABC-2 type transport system permease protein